jgi:hypothetical protein
MVIGRGRRREHPMDTSKGDHVTFGHYGCCTTSGCVYPRELRKGQVTFGSHVTTTKKKAREKTGHAQNLLPVRNTSGQVTLALPVKRPHSNGINVEIG